VETACTEEVFKIAENTIKKAKVMSGGVPIIIIWDSVAASSPLAELTGDYDKQSIGLQARAISKGMRKITQVIGAENVTFVCLNQTRTKIGVMYGDPTTTPGGMAIPFHASVRIKLGAGQQLKNKAGDIIGINVSAKTIKNKIAPPFRTCNFEIHFGVGIKEHEQLFNILRRAGSFVKDSIETSIEGTGSWKTITVVNVDTGEEILSRKFYKADFYQVLADEQYRKYLDGFIDHVMIKEFHVTGDDVSDAEEVFNLE
jgi:protein RecA